MSVTGEKVAVKAPLALRVPVAVMMLLAPVAVVLVAISTVTLPVALSPLTAAMLPVTVYEPP